MGRYYVPSWTYLCLKVYGAALQVLLCPEVVTLHELERWLPTLADTWFCAAAIADAVLYSYPIVGCDRNQGPVSAKRHSRHRERLAACGDASILISSYPSRFYRRINCEPVASRARKCAHLRVALTLRISLRIRGPLLRVEERLRERIVLDLQASHFLILVRRHCDKLGLGEAIRENLREVT